MFFGDAGGIAKILQGFPRRPKILAFHDSEPNGAPKNVMDQEAL